MKVVYTPEALCDLLRLKEFIAKDNMVSASFMAEHLLGSVEKIRKFPEIGKPVQKASEPNRMRDFVTRNYVIRYLLSEVTICILRIWHGKESR